MVVGRGVVEGYARGLWDHPSCHIGSGLMRLKLEGWLSLWEGYLVLLLSEDHPVRLVLRFRF